MDEGPKTLYPEDDCYLDVEEVIARLKDEFAYVVVDADKGAASIDNAIDYYRSRKQNASDSDEHFDAIIDELKSNRSYCRLLILADKEDYGDAYLTTLVEPSKPLFFGFSSAGHEEAAMPMVQRCASILEYEVE